jgi:GNAT superfamily N-acetyltransferase
MKIVLFDKSSHNRNSFSSGNEELDQYLKNILSQDVKRGLIVALVLIDESNQVLGFYTLSNSAIQRNTVPEFFRSKTGNYGDIPVTLLGRLAVDLRLKGQGFGKILVLDAMTKAYQTSVIALGSVALIVDPIDADAKSFYLKFGFQNLIDSGRMFLPMRTIKEAIEF